MSLLQRETGEEARIWRSGMPNIHMALATFYVRLKAADGLPAWLSRMGYPGLMKKTGCNRRGFRIEV